MQKIKNILLKIFIYSSIIQNRKTIFSPTLQDSYYINYEWRKLQCFNISLQTLRHMEVS